MFSATGPTICTTSGLCVPGEACVAERLFFAPLACANALVNAPVASSATKTPMRQKTAAIKTRRLKKADCEVDFFFMDGFSNEHFAFVETPVARQRVFVFPTLLIFPRSSGDGASFLARTRKCVNTFLKFSGAEPLSTRLALLKS